jgi:hypothetical protein
MSNLLEQLMYEATAVNHTDGEHNAPKGHVYCRFMVEMQHISSFDSHLTEIGAVQVKRPDGDIEEYTDWGDPELCVCYWAFVPQKGMEAVAERAELFKDMR